VIRRIAWQSQNVPFELLQQARKRESSFSALGACFRSGDIVGFCFPQQELTTKIPEAADD